MWRDFDVKTKAVKIYMVKHIFKVYQFYRANNFEVNPFLNSAAERWARPFLHKHAKSYMSKFNQEREKWIPEEEIEQDFGMSYADAEERDHLLWSWKKQAELQKEPQRSLKSLQNRLAKLLRFMTKFPSIEIPAKDWQEPNQDK